MKNCFFNAFLFENSYYFSSGLDVVLSTGRLNLSSWFNNDNNHNNNVINYKAPYIRVIKLAQRRYTKINVVAE